MYDRDELFRAQIDNFLDAMRARVEKVSTETGFLAVRQAMSSGMIAGSFADSKRDYKRRERNYFIETPSDENGMARQLWLPALKWFGLGTIRQREIIATNARPEERFAAWQEARPLITDLDGYSEYQGEGQALYEEAKLTLKFMDAEDSRMPLDIKVYKFKN